MFKEIVMATNFKDYPKWMHHPNHQAAVIEMEDGPDKGLFRAGGKQVSPEMFPPQMVTTREQEQQWAARGYLPSNCADAEEYERTILEGSVDTSNRGGAYPKWKYSPTEMPLIVQTQKEELALQGVWFDTPSEAQDYDSDNEEYESEIAPAVIEKSNVDKRSKAYRQSKK
jgi:ribulose kinase